jgi:hypothetical protein
VTTIIVLAVIAVAAGVLQWLSTRTGSSAANGPPPLFYSLDPVSPPPEAHANENVAPQVAVNGGGMSPASTNGNGVPPTPASGNGVPRTPAKGNGVPHVHTNGNGIRPPVDRPTVRPSPVDSPRMHGRAGAGSRDAVDDNAETIRFVRESDLDTAMQLLPGRLEVLEGSTPHREIRFVRVPGEAAHVVLGREIRLSPHYIGLGSPTVSRRHARFDFTNNQWVVRNLSRTNPLIVNDDELIDPDVARPLADGDRLELGDVVLRFHAH